MKIIILRHAQRNDSHHFFTTLTEEGEKRADALKDILPSNIDEIYCSPFLRTVETIFPYCNKYDQQIRIEYSLYKRCTRLHFNYTNYIHTEKDLLEHKYNVSNIIDNNYKSILMSSNIILNPSDNDVKNKIFPFIYKLCKKYKDTDRIILIVTHKAICNTIKKVFNKNVQLKDDFPQGHFEEIIINSDWKGIDGL
jgi:broad specificity phosphatase PhoE